MARALRIRFERTESLKYIAHLDTLRVFERAFKRSGIPIAWSQGFNPRQKLVFGLPMSIGLTSEAEYADVELAGDVDPEAFVEIVNKSLPEGIQILDAVEQKIKGNIMNQITAARYEITFDTEKAMNFYEIQNFIMDFMDKESILMMKKTKKGFKPANIRPMIFNLSSRKTGIQTFVLEAFLSAGAENNLRADLLMDAFRQETGLNIRVITMHRKALYASSWNEWKSPLEVALEGMEMNYG